MFPTSSYIHQHLQLSDLYLFASLIENSFLWLARVRHVFIFLFAIWFSSLWLACFNLCSIFLSIWVFFLFICKSSLHIDENFSVSARFFPVCDCFFTFRMMLFCYTNVLCFKEVRSKTFFFAVYFVRVLCLCSPLPLLSLTSTPLYGLLKVKFFFIQVFNSIFDFVYGVR